MSRDYSMIAKAIRILAPKGKFAVGKDYSSLNWIDEHITGVPKPSEKEINAKVEELQNAEPMRLLREERNRRLTETDWWVLPDRTASQEQKDYRQALRDLPSTASPTLDKQGNLTNVTWPTKPE